MTPNWEAFGRDVLGEWPGLYDLEASEIFDLAVKHGLVKEVAGGFDPERHVDFYAVDLQKGDPFYEYTFQQRSREDGQS
jgi:hypothetical protein